MSKYGAVRTEVDGISFASKKEARRYSELRLLERAGKIECLRLQPRYPLVVANKLVCTYVADFAYHLLEKDEDGWKVYSLIVEDAKGMKTPVYKLKAKLFEACMGFAITEV